MEKNNRNSNAFTSLVEAFQTPVYALCSLLLGDGPASDQAAQECFIQAYKQFHEPNLPWNTQTWLLRIAYRQCMSSRALLTGHINRAGMGETQISTGKSATIQSLLAGLEPEDRAVIALRNWYRLELSDIAWVMGVDCDKVKNRLQQAKKTLATQYCQEALRLPA